MTAAAGPLEPRTPAERQAQGLEVWVRESRRRCGLGPTITDEDALLRAAALVAAGLRRREEGGGRDAP